jgi:hypothetical protein
MMPIDFAMTLPLGAVPVPVMVWLPGGVLSGIVKVSLAVPFASAVTVPRKTGALCSVTETVEPGMKPVHVTVSEHPAQSSEALSVTVGVTGG